MANNALSTNPTSTYQIPTFEVTLPSGGVLYPENTGTLTVEELTAKDEDILMSKNLIQSGKVFDVLLEKKIKNSPVPVSELLLGDRNQVMIALRSNAYGNLYKTKVIDTTNDDKLMAVEIDFDQLPIKGLNVDADENNEFLYTLPKTGRVVTFRLLTAKDADYINKRAESQKNKVTGVIPYLTTRLETQIMSIDGDRDKSHIIQAVSVMHPMDSLGLREKIEEVDCNVELTQEFTSDATGETFTGTITLDVDFLYPKGLNRA